MTNSKVIMETKLKEKAEELEKFLQDRLSEDDYKTVGRLLKEISDTFTCSPYELED